MATLRKKTEIVKDLLERFKRIRELDTTINLFDDIRRLAIFYKEEAEENEQLEVSANFRQIYYLLDEYNEAQE